jgi:hypothetical protein
MYVFMRACEHLSVCVCSERACGPPSECIECVQACERASVCVRASEPACVHGMCSCERASVSASVSACERASVCASDRACARASEPACMHGACGRQTSSRAPNSSCAVRCSEWSLHSRSPCRAGGRVGGNCSAWVLWRQRRSAYCVATSAPFAASDVWVENLQRAASVEWVWRGCASPVVEWRMRRPV